MGITSMPKGNNLLHIGLSIAQKNFKKLIRENLLGLLWIFLTPLLYSFFFLLVKQSVSGDQLSSLELKKSAFNAFIGLLLIQLWFQSIQETSNIVRKKRNTLRSLDVSVFPFIFAIFIETTIYLIIRVVIIAATMLIFNITPTTQLSNLGIYIPFAFFCFITTGLFLGLLLTPWATLFNDVRNFLNSSLMPVALLSPIFYLPVNESGSFLYWVNHFLPFATIQAVVSDSIFQVSTIYFLPLLLWTILSLIGSIVFCYLIRQQTPILLERLGN